MGLESAVLDWIFLSILVVCALAVVHMKDLLSAVMSFTVYSLVMTIVWTRLNAVDVAITEAAVGAGITTVLFIAVISKTRRVETENKNKHFLLNLLIVFVVCGALLYGTLDMPDFGDPSAPPNQHVKPRYIERGYEETGVPNIVTAVLASYRGYDTLGETIVIFTAGMGVVLLLRRKGSKKEEGKDGVDGDAKQ